MKRRQQTREENEDSKRGSQNPNQRETEEDNNNDKLSDFPDSILLHILSFLYVKEAVRTCLLSTRWKHLWKHIPTLTLNSRSYVFNYRKGKSFTNLISYVVDNSKSKSFTNFVNRFLSLRDSSTALTSLDFQCEDCVTHQLLKRIVTYNVNRLRLDCPIQHFPPSLFSCPSLTSLALQCPYARVIFPNSLNFPALTYLKLVSFSFDSGNDGRIEPFFTFSRLNTLILESCTVRDEQSLCISSTKILDLSIVMSNRYYMNIVLFVPSLCTFAFTGNHFHKLKWRNLSSIKQVSIDIPDEINWSPFYLLDFLREITDIKSLTVTPRTLWVLSLYPDILNLKLSSWCKLESLKLCLKLSSYWRTNVKMELACGKSWKENDKLREIIKAKLEPIYSSILDGMIEFLLQNSSSAKVDILLEKLYDIY